MQRFLLDAHKAECECAKLLRKLCGIDVERKDMDEHRQSGMHLLHAKVDKAIAEGAAERRKYLFIPIAVVIFAMLIPNKLTLTAPEVPPSNSHSHSMQSLQDSLTAALEKQIADLKKQLGAKEKVSPSAEIEKMDKKVAALEM